MIVVVAKEGYACEGCKQHLEKGVKCIRLRYRYRGAYYLCPRCFIKKTSHLIKHLGIPKLKVELWK